MAARPPRSGGLRSGSGARRGSFAPTITRIQWRRGERGRRDSWQGIFDRKGYSSPWDLEPWGRTFGLHSPMYRAHEAGAKVLMLGVDFFTSTYIHIVEVIYWHKLRCHDRGAAFPSLDRLALGAYWDRVGAAHRGRVGDADCRLFRAKAYVDTLLAEVERNAHLYLR